MRLTRLLAGVAVLLSGCIPAAAQVYSLDSCRNMAVRNNKAIRMAEEGITGAGYARKAAKAAYLPGVDLVAGYTYNQHKVSLLGEDAKLPTMVFDPLTQKYIYDVLIDPGTMQPIINPETGTPIPDVVAVIPKSAMEFDTHNVFAGAVTLTQPVYMGGQIRAMNEITKYAEQLAISARDMAVQELIYGVDEAYWLVVSLQQKKKLAESFVNVVDTLKYNVDCMVREGVATRSDALKVEVKLNDAQLALTKVDNGLSLSRMALAQLCGLPIETGMQVDDSGLDSESKTAPGVTYSMGDVYAARPDLASMRHGIAMAGAQADLAKGDMLPKVAIVGAYSVTNPNVIDGFEKRFGGGFSIGATLTVPLWHWGANYNKYRAAKSAKHVAELALADAEEKVELQVRQARYSFDEAYKTYDMTVVNQRNADENLRQAQIGFREGVLTTEDVMMAQTAWLAAHSEKIDAEIGIYLRKVYLSKVLGRLK